jgi:hypothetical protein
MAILPQLSVIDAEDNSMPVSSPLHPLGPARMLPVAREVGLKQVQITTDPNNLASQRVIEANAGRLVGESVNPRFGSEPKLRLSSILRGNSARADSHAIGSEGVSNRGQAVEDGLTLHPSAL